MLPAPDAGPRMLDRWRRATAPIGSWSYRTWHVGGRCTPRTRQKLSVHKGSYIFLEIRQIFRNAPSKFLIAHHPFDSADSVGRGLEPEVNVGGECIAERLLYRDFLRGRDFKSASQHGFRRLF